MVIVTEKKSGAENTVNEKLTNFAKVISSGAYNKTSAALRELVAKNNNTMFYDMGGSPAALMAYVSGVVSGIEAFIMAEIGRSEESQSQIKIVYDLLLKTRTAANTILKNL